MGRSDFLSCFESQFMEELKNRGLIRNKDFIYGYPFKYPTRIADFVFPEAKLIVELDGPHHVGKIYHKDKWKDKLAEKQGWFTIRFDMEKMKDMKSCVNEVINFTTNKVLLG